MCALNTSFVFSRPRFVPLWDNVEPLKARMDAGTIARGQSAALVYGMATGTDEAAAAAAVAQAVDRGRAANVGWHYVQDGGSGAHPWGAAPSEHVLDAQAARVRCT